MTLHDSYARLTPYELSFPELEWARERFQSIREEARERRVDASDPGRFILLAAVGQMLRDLRPLEEEVELIHSHGALLFHAFHFWEQGEPLFLTEVGAARRAVAAEASGRSRPPTSAGYVQLPQHMFWTGGGDSARQRAVGEAPESVDGLFWVFSEGSSVGDEPGGRVHLLIVAGMRSGRPGFSVIPIPPVSEATMAEWGEAVVREGGTDFESELPGSALKGLHQLTSPGEALKLAVRLWALPAGASSSEAPPVENVVQRSLLPYHRISVP
jgi:hypothetical protein